MDPFARFSEFPYALCGSQDLAGELFRCPSLPLAARNLIQRRDHLLSCHIANLPLAEQVREPVQPILDRGALFLPPICFAMNC